MLGEKAQNALRIFRECNRQERPESLGSLRRCVSGQDPRRWVNWTEERGKMFCSKSTPRAKVLKQVRAYYDQGNERSQCDENVIGQGKGKGAETAHQESWLLFEARWPAIERFSGEGQCHLHFKTLDQLRCNYIYCSCLVRRSLSGLDQWEEIDGVDFYSGKRIYRPQWWAGCEPRLNPVFLEQSSNQEPVVSNDWDGKAALGVDQFYFKCINLEMSIIQIYTDLELRRDQDRDKF